jgi:RNA polymerase sigma-70 factor (ECF subfamily)
LVLRDVLGYRAAEAAEMLESSEESVKAALKRARATMDAHVASRRTKPPSRGSRQEMELAQRFADAFETDDIDAVVALLTHDAWLTMPPSTLEYQGHEAIGAFLREVESWADGHRNRLIPTRANSQPAFACYRTDPQAAIAHASGLIVLTLDGDRIAAITRFLDAGVLSRFGLPRTIPV